jgi:hypothetical protein
LINSFCFPCVHPIQVLSYKVKELSNRTQLSETRLLSVEQSLGITGGHHSLPLTTEEWEEAVEKAQTTEQFIEKQESKMRFLRKRQDSIAHHFGAHHKAPGILEASASAEAVLQQARSKRRPSILNPDMVLGPSMMGKESRQMSAGSTMPSLLVSAAARRSVSGDYSDRGSSPGTGASD